MEPNTRHMQMYVNANITEIEQALLRGHLVYVCFLHQITILIAKMILFHVQ